MTSADVLDGELTVTGRITPASNATFYGQIGDVAVVYKPIAGERPLWDFPDGTLAYREVAAYRVSQTLGWDLVPTTWLREGRFGTGMVQVWHDADDDADAVTLVPSAQVPVRGWRHVFDGLDSDDTPISLIHEDTSALRRMAVFDIIVNNADRKGSHVLAMADGHRYGIDHGVTFHTDYKLRTVLWGWIDSALTDDERHGIERVHDALSGELGEALDTLLHRPEIDALAHRCQQLLSRPVFPGPHGGMPAIPWPPL